MLRKHFYLKPFFNILFFVILVFFLIKNVKAGVIGNIKITNISYDTFTVSWISNIEESGSIGFYSSDPSSSPYNIYDKRSNDYIGHTHYIEIKELNPNTFYFFEVKSGEAIDDNNGELYSVKTALMDESPPDPTGNRSTGTVIDENSNKINDAVIYLKIINADSRAESSELSFYSVNGLWLIPLDQARKINEDGTIGDYFEYVFDRDNVQIYADAGPVIGSIQQTMQINESYNITLIPSTEKPILSVIPSEKTVNESLGTLIFKVSNTGSGTMHWTASETPGTDWLSIISGVSGINSGTITVKYSANFGCTQRTGIIEVNATDALSSPQQITITQEGNTTPILSVTPLNQNINAHSGTTTFTVSNSGCGTMNWTAQVTASTDWLSIISGASGANSGSITVQYSANSGCSQRIGVIEVNAAGASSSPQQITVTQEGNTTSILSVTPLNQNTSAQSGTTTFTVSNLGCDTMNWTASVTSGTDWLSIISGASGTNSGTIEVYYDQNMNPDMKIGEITVIANGATESPFTVTITPLAPLCGFQKRLFKGYNSFAPVFHLDYLASDCVLDIQSYGIDCTQVIKFNNEQTCWDTYDTNPLIPDFLKNNFSINAGKGYFVYCLNEGIWTQQCEPIISPLILPINKGYTSISIPTWAHWIKKASDIYDLDSQITQVIKFNREETCWDTYDPNPNLPSFLWNNFDVQSGEGYFVYSTSSFDLEIKSPITISNISNSMFTISWLTGQSVSGHLRCRKTGEGTWHEVEDDRGSNWKGYTHHVTVRGLSEGIYEYDLINEGVIDDNQGLHYQTELSNIGLPSLGQLLGWGRVFESDGNSIAYDSIVYLYIKDIDSNNTDLGESSWLSSIHKADKQYYWDIDKKILRTKDLSQYYNFTDTGFEEHIIVNAKDGIVEERIINPFDDSPMENIILPGSSPLTRQRIGYKDFMPGIETAYNIELDPEDVRFESIHVSNKTSNSFVLSFTSNLPCAVEVYYGLAPDNLTDKAYDTRGISVRSRNHYIKLVNLEPDREYYYEIRVNNVTKLSNKENVFSNIGLPSFSTLSFGQVLNNDESSTEEAIIYVTLKNTDGQGNEQNSSLLSTLTESGWWKLDLSIARRTDGSAYFDFSKDSPCIINMKGILPGAAPEIMEIEMDSISPAPTIHFGLEEEDNLGSKSTNHISNIFPGNLSNNLFGLGGFNYYWAYPYSNYYNNYYMSPFPLNINNDLYSFEIYKFHNYMKWHFSNDFFILSPLIIHNSSNVGQNVKRKL